MPSANRLKYLPIDDALAWLSLNKLFYSGSNRNKKKWDWVILYVFTKKLFCACSAKLKHCKMFLIILFHFLSLNIKFPFYIFFIYILFIFCIANQISSLVYPFHFNVYVGSNFKKIISFQTCYKVYIILRKFPKVFFKAASLTAGC